MTLQDGKNVLNINPSVVNKLRFAPKLGDEAVVSTLIKDIRQETYQNDYRTHCAGWHREHWLYLC